jgi:hypothetical protein
MTDQPEKKATASSSYSISDVSGSGRSNDYLVTITHGGKAVGEVIIRTTSTAGEAPGDSKSK